MAGIWNVNSVNNVEARKILSKLSFTVGENFLARVVNLDKVTGEVLLKLLDGWQFSAKLQKPLDNLQEGLLRFEVEGFEDGKLQIKVLNNKKQDDLQKNTIDSQLEERGINVSKDDYVLLDKMVKHEIPLTKENISNIKTLVDFRGKISSNPEEENAFIAKYMDSKGISADSTEGIKVKETLKAFFNQLKSISEDDIVTLFENNIDLTEDNIKSFNNIFKGSSAIYNDIKNKLANLINHQQNTIELASEEINKINNEAASSNIVVSKEKNQPDSKSIMGNKQNIMMSGSAENQMDMKDIEGSIGNLKDNDVKLDKNTNSSNSEKGKSISVDKDSNEVKVSIGDNSEANLEKITKKTLTIDDIAKNIKEQISTKTEEMKNIIKTVLEQTSEAKPESYSNIIQTLDKSINDFKVFNSMSNQYYYLDLPINLDNHEYECKLMIKDERKKGKKIDSTDVKIAASVNTIHMGVVDAYIRVNKNNMNIDIKCDGTWMKLLDIGKDKILGDISSMGYNVYVNVAEREKEMNITNCRDFFGDNNLGMINIKV